MYLRLGWVVGNAGLFGAIAIILIAKSVTLSTTLAMSSMASNIKVGAGGAYTFISRSLGLEAGGSIGIPLYIAQTLSAALYIVGFTEGWAWVFPEHDALVVALTAWIILTITSLVSTSLAIRLQYVIMAVIILSLISFFLSPVRPNIGPFPHVGSFESASFWEAFAVFFPAVTGIMAGIALSGELKNPRRSIMVGTMSAVLVTMAIYLVLAYFFTKVATVEELRLNPFIMADRALFGPVVFAGVMGATLSSAIGSIIGAPRVLQALAQENTVPLSNYFSVRSKTNEPRRAIAFTGIIIGTALVLGDLNSLAALITMFFSRYLRHDQSGRFY